LKVGAWNNMFDLVKYIVLHNLTPLFELFGQLAMTPQYPPRGEYALIYYYL